MDAKFAPCFEGVGDTHDFDVSTMLSASDIAAFCPLLWQMILGWHFFYGAWYIWLALMCCASGTNCASVKSVKSIHVNGEKLKLIELSQFMLVLLGCQEGLKTDYNYFASFKKAWHWLLSRRSLEHMASKTISIAFTGVVHKLRIDYMS